VDKDARRRVRSEEGRERSEKQHFDTGAEPKENCVAFLREQH
jgi:hypothetical protein